MTDRDLVNEMRHVNDQLKRIADGELSAMTNAELKNITTAIKDLADAVRDMRVELGAITSVIEQHD